MEKHISTKAQVWGYDLMIAITIFFVGVVGIYIYAANFSQDSESLESFFYQGNAVSSLILSQGSPDSWNLTSYEIPGIISKERINQTKLENFYSLDYNETKKKFGLNYEFYFYFPGIEISSNLIEGVGKKPENPANLVQVERFTIYKNKPVKFTIFIWN